MFLKEHKGTALIHKDQNISYKTVIQEVKRFSSILDINLGDKVSIFSENRPQWVYALFSIWERGGIPVPIDFMSTPQEVTYILKDCKPSTIFCSKTTEKVLKEAILPLDYKPNIIIFEDVKNLNLHSYPSPKRKKEDPALILYTSGTTGTPKGVVLTFDNLLSNIEGILEVKIASKEDKTLAILPFHHSYPLMVSLLIPIYLGATIIFLEKLSADEILEKMNRYKVSILIGVPRLYSLFHRNIFSKIDKKLTTRYLFKTVKIINSKKLSKLVFKKVHNVFGGNIKYFVSGGAKLDIEIAKDLSALGFNIIEGYGLTETSPIVTFNPPEKIKLGSVGKPIKDVYIKLENGEVLVKGRNVMKGYYNRPEDTAKVLKNGWLYTGDLGYIDNEGYLFITGRKKEIIVLPNGKNINPEEIEQKILKISDLVKEVGVIQENGKLVAIIYPNLEKLKEKKILNLKETLKWEVIDVYNRKVPDYKRIYKFYIVKTELPKTRIGKLKRFLLPKLLESEKTKRLTHIKEPDFKEYKIIKDYLKRITKKEVYPNSHLEIDLGLDSLEKVEFITFLEKTFGVDISDEELSKYETVEEIALFIKNKKTKLETVDTDWSKVLKENITMEIPQRRYSLLAIKYITKPVFKLYFRLEVKGVENLPSSSFIIAPNHQSYLDGFLIISSLPNHILKDLYFLAEEKFFPPNTIKGKIGTFFHIVTINVNKNLKVSLQNTAYLLRKGKKVVIFPEGARTRTGELLEFKPFFAILSKELNLPVIPLTIKGAFEALPIDSKFPKPRKIQLIYSKPIYPKEKTYTQIVELTKQKIKENLK
ncbi:MAG: AMP-binding protein [Aquificae bacterium]|nr:AMP-binding protein [Aquificota bacterium]